MERQKGLLVAVVVGEWRGFVGGIEVGEGEDAWVT